MSGFDKPNYTETPNMLFDDLMKNMSESELKVTLAIVRQTFGYHKKSDAISLTQLEKMTGLSRTACVDGVESMMKHGLVTKTLGKRNVSIFTLVVNDDQSTKATSTSSEKLPVTSSNLLHTKETDKETDKSADASLQPKQDSIALYIKAWLDGQTVQPATNQYGLKNNRSIAKAICDAGFTPEQVTAYTKVQAATAYWSGKLVPIKTIGDNIAASVKKLQPTNDKRIFQDESAAAALKGVNLL